MVLSQYIDVIYIGECYLNGLLAMLIYLEHW